MKEEVLREIAGDFLVPLFSGAQLEESAEQSGRRDGLVSLRDPLKIAFKVNRDDDYRLVLSRRQAYAKSSEAVVTEINVVRAFAGVVATMEDPLDSPLKQDLLSTIQRRIVARATGRDLETLVLSGIDQLVSWGLALYEGSPISASIGFSARDQPEGTVDIRDIAQHDFGAVLGNGFDTLMEFDFKGRFVNHDILEFANEPASFCPLRQSAIAGWTTSGANQIALSLNRLGEILVFRNGQLLFAPLWSMAFPHA